VSYIFILYVISGFWHINTFINRSIIQNIGMTMEDKAVVDTAPIERPPVQHVIEANPLLARVEMPGTTYQLPSRGLFYRNGELRDDVEIGEVHVSPMSAYDEILMKSPDQLYSGEAVEKVFRRCIKQVLKPSELIAKDVDFLLVCLRQITYGNDMEVTYTHNCEEAKTNSYIVQLSDFITTTKKIDPTTVGKIYTMKMENGQVVKLHPSKFKDIIKMYQDTETLNTTPEAELDLAVFAIGSIIYSVDDITNKQQIAEWIREIPAGWLGELSSIIEKASDFGPNYTLKTACKDCGEPIEIHTPVNPISFFM